MTPRTRSHALAAAALVLSAAASPAAAQGKAADPLAAEIETRMTAVMPKVIAWRRDIHEHPELSNQEVRTAALVEKHLRALGLEVQPNVGKTGVIGILRGGKPGPVVALRADMDALPVTELVDLPFKSTVRTMYNGQEVGVMHACGHDNHVAIMMGTAEVLAGMKERIPGTVKFIFQPAEEGLGGAEAMIADGALQNPRPSAIFGLHVWPSALGSLSTRAGGFMAAADQIDIVVKGRQTHGSAPWSGVDPIVIAAQIVMGLQTVASRQIDVTAAPAVITIGMIQGGNRGNIIPDSVVMIGTIRTFDPEMRKDIHARVKRTVEDIAHSGGATARVTLSIGGLITQNDASLLEKMTPTLQRTAGDGGFKTINPVTGSEDFPAFTKEIPGLFYFLGVAPKGMDQKSQPANHSPLFFADEAALPTGVRAMTNLAVDYLKSGGIATAKPAMKQ
ncbi:amidohydrolase [Gemmatimonas sp.]|uniref:amidohydrolase n=1 Tax=Gemmatimonas sp. TaxID=1962908 RepID=UPI00286D84A1|nr:amidohydrolase [Gemmatimonas sp.]